MKKVFFTLLITSLIGLQNSKAQQFDIHPVYYTIFDQDSLSGFNETEARAVAINERFLGSEFKIKMYRLKREYINNKYGLITSEKDRYQGSYFNIPQTKSNPVAGCTNEDFEASVADTVNASYTLAGWTVVDGYKGYVGSSSAPSLTAAFPNGLTGADACNRLGCCPLPSARSQIIDCGVPGGYIDQVIGAHYPIFSVFGTGTVNGSSSGNSHLNQGLFGTKVIRLNDAMLGDYSMSKLTKTFSVTAVNNLFEFAFVSVLSPGHGCCDAGGFLVLLYDHGTLPSGTATLITCPIFSVSAPSSACTATVPMVYREVGTGLPYTGSSFNNIYNPWKLSKMELSSYMGHYITVEVIVSDCTAGGHFGYVYFDSQCRSSEIELGSDSSHIVCAPVATLTGPQGFSSYQWSGPAGHIDSNAVTQVSVTGVYTLVVNAQGLCAPLSKTISVTVSNTITGVNSSDSLTCSGEPVILTVQNMVNCSWNTGDQTPSIFVSPDSTTIYYVNGTNIDGCPISATYTQQVEDCTGISELKNSVVVKFFPNPNNGEFTIEIQRGLKKAELIIENTLGQLVHKQSLSSGVNTVKIKDPVKGIFYYRISSQTRNVSTGKFKIE